MAVAMVTAGIGILGMFLFSAVGSTSLSAIPFATSIALVAGAPKSLPASNRSILLGHLLSAAVGIVVAKIAGGGAFSVALAVGLAVSCMLAANAFHPPAAISPLIINQGEPELHYLLVPVFAGAVLVALLARISEGLQSRFENTTPKTHPENEC